MVRGLLHVLGVDNLAGPWYGFWSGFAGDLVYLGAAWAIVRRNNCHVNRCWRLGRLQAGEFKVCRRHHPDGAPDVRTIRERYHLHLGQRPGKG